MNSKLSWATSTNLVLATLIVADCSTAVESMLVLWWGAPRRSTTTCRRRRWWWGRVTLSRSCSWFLPFWMSLQSSVGHWIQHQSHLLFSLLSLQKTHFSWKRREVASFWKTPACGGRICENPAKRSCWVNLGLNGLSSICKLTLKKSKQRNS